MYDTARGVGFPHPSSYTAVLAPNTAVVFSFCCVVLLLLFYKEKLNNNNGGEIHTTI